MLAAGHTPTRTAMDQAITHVLGLMDVVDNLYAKALHGLDPAEATRTPCQNANPMVWMAGQLAQSRGRLARLIGVEQEVPWPTLFKLEVPDPPGVEYSSIAEIRRSLESADRAMTPLASVDPHMY